MTGWKVKAEEGAEGGTGGERERVLSEDNEALTT